jgi:hypothetical protein
VRIVFLLRHALYLRHFESALRTLAERGHVIMLVFTPFPRPVDYALRDTLIKAYSNIVEEPIAPRTGWWWPVSDGGRTLRDFVRYLDPAFDDAPSLVERGGSRMPSAVRWLLTQLPRKFVRPLLKFLLSLIDRAIPPDQSILAALRRWSPDLLVVSPMLDFTYGQTDYIKAARHLGIPTVLAVASWDNLTNKGVIQVIPDRVILWNAIQKREAIDLHNIEPERIHITGAQLYDHWFDMVPSVDHQTFCARAGGLDPSQPIILYLCSSSFICSDEVSFVQEWLSQLRSSKQPLVAQANVIIRPHPTHAAQWEDVDLSGYERAVIWPRNCGMPIDDERKHCYYDSLYHSGAVVGINTSGFIEAGIVGRRTLTLVTDHFKGTQEGTLHFHYLTEGGLVQVARSFEDHAEQLSRALANSAGTEHQIKQFIASFVRPRGLEMPATQAFVEAVETARELKPQPWHTPAYAPLVRAAIWPAAILTRREVLQRINPGMPGGIERTNYKVEPSIAR